MKNQIFKTLIAIAGIFILLATVSTSITNFGYTADNVNPGCNCAQEVTTYHLEDWYIDGNTKVFEYAVIKNGIVQHTSIQVVVTYKSVAARVNADIDYHATGTLYYAGNVRINGYRISNDVRVGSITEYLPYIPEVLAKSHLRIR